MRARRILYISSAGLILAANGVALAANALSLYLSARALGAAGRGAYSAILVWALTSASLTDLSLGPTLAKAIAVGHSADHLRRFLVRAYIAAATLAALIMLVLLGTVLARSVPDRLTALIALSIPAGLTLSAWGIYFFQGRGDQVGYALARALPGCIGALLIAGQAVRGITLDGAIGAFAVGYWLVGAWCAVVAWRTFRQPLPRDATPGAVNLLAYAVRAHVGSIATIASSRLDVLLLTLIVPLAALGNYALAVSLTVPVAFVGGSLAAATFQRIGAATTNQRELIAGVWKRFLLPTTALAGCVMAAGLAVPLVLGQQFEPAVLPALILSLGSIGLGAMNLGTNILQARGVPGTASALAVTAAILSAVTLLLLVPRFGIVGAAISSAATYLVIGGIGFPLTLSATPPPSPSPASGGGEKRPVPSAASGGGEPRPEVTLA